MIQRIKLTGRRGNIPAAQRLGFGSASVIYEAGNLRYIGIEGIEIIRMIYFAVRDKDWLTISPVVSEEKIRKKRNGFEIVYKASYRHEEIDFQAVISIVSGSANRLTLEMSGYANSTFLRNRIGFCILHPISGCAGRNCEIIHTDGSLKQDKFPEDVSPHQPFKDIREMRWKINNSLEGSLQFEGDVFETEDQRNWTDASYKTYSTPLDLPYPVEIAKGTRLFQKVVFSLVSKKQEVADRHPHLLKQQRPGIIFNVGNQPAGKLPDIGVCSSSRSKPLSDSEANLLKGIPFSHIRGELFLSSLQMEDQYASLSGESIKTGFPAEICLVFGNDPQAELSRFLLLYIQRPIPLRRIIIFSDKDKVAANSVLSSVIPAIRREFPGIPAGTGTNGNFAQLNRSRPDFQDIDFITFAIHPQEHASDERTMVENTAAQKYAVKSASNFAIQKPVIVSPVTLQRRFNANRHNYELPSEGSTIPMGMDSRQMSLFGAAWTTGSLKYLLDSDAKSITYYESVGERGIFMGDNDSRWPYVFEAHKGLLFPVFHVFRILLNKGKFKIPGSYSTNPLAIDGFTVSTGNSGLAFLSNMTRQRQKFELIGTDGCRVIMKMNTENFDYLSRSIPNQGAENQGRIVGNPREYTVEPYETLVLEYRL